MQKVRKSKQIVVESNGVIKMRKFIFKFDDEEEIVEFDDDITDEEVEREYQEWLFDKIDEYTACYEVK